uniref:Stromal cell-derived factor 2 n=1 Tax=Phallusia mammillata TaxID=59560 RepID=A0A6F9DR43_9ASCI|nr:stromal cell-derived factor 2 [Phallusia mammillata]
MSSQDDANSYWQIRSSTQEKIARGTPVKCGQSIRLTHIKTFTNLHSHHFQAPMSSGQEVSCFGEDGAGDHLDNWVVVCDGTYWGRKNLVQFKHEETESILACSSKVYGRPINGQQEVLATTSSDRSKSTYWKTMEGIILRPGENMGVQ